MIDRFALLSYATNNLGDEIQSVAARQFLPSVDLLVERDSWTPSSPNPVGPYKLIMNGWFTHSPEKWPPPGFLQPLLTSMHMTILGALLALASRPVYEHHTGLASLSPLQDQHLGGAVMILVGGIAYLSGGLVLTAGLLHPAPGTKEAPA